MGPVTARTFVPTSSRNAWRRALASSWPRTSFFFHPHVRLRIFEWMGVAPEEVDIVLDEANNLPDQLRELASVSLPQESVRRARAEILDQGDFPLPDGPSALHFIEALQAEIDESWEPFPRVKMSRFHRLRSRSASSSAPGPTWNISRLGWVRSFSGERTFVTFAARTVAFLAPGSIPWR